MNNRNNDRGGCPGVTRRSFLADTGMGFTGLALGAMLAGESARERRKQCRPHGVNVQNIGPRPGRSNDTKKRMQEGLDTLHPRRP